MSREQDTCLAEPLKHLGIELGLFVVIIRIVSRIPFYFGLAIHAPIHTGFAACSAPRESHLPRSWRTLRLTAITLVLSSVR